MGGKAIFFTFECWRYFREKSASEEAIVCQASKFMWVWLKYYMT